MLIMFVGFVIVVVAVTLESLLIMYIYIYKHVSRVFVITYITVMRDNCSDLIKSNSTLHEMNKKKSSQTGLGGALGLRDEIGVEKD